MIQEQIGDIISVTGRGCVHVVPDVTRLEVSISSVFKTYEAAYAQARENSSWMVKILEFNNKSGKLAKTVHLDISDRMVNVYDDESNLIGTKKDGYNLNQRVKIDLAIDNVLVNKIVRGVGKFIKDAQIDIGYTVQNQKPYQLKMLARAVEDATEKAKIMAEACGCVLGKVKSINYGNDGCSVYSQARNIHSNEEAMACSSDTLDITPDDLSVSDEVEVAWHLEKK